MRLMNPNLSFSVSVWSSFQRWPFQPPSSPEWNLAARCVCPEVCIFMWRPQSPFSTMPQGHVFARARGMFAREKLINPPSLQLTSIPLSHSGAAAYERTDAQCTSAPCRPGRSGDQMSGLRSFISPFVTPHFAPRHGVLWNLPQKIFIIASQTNQCNAREVVREVTSSCTARPASTVFVWKTAT